MTTGAYEIRGGDYQRGGLASSNLKELLKRVGAQPADIRRAMIAAYEAEMNVVIHASKGSIRYTLDPGQLDIEVVDEGPGIPDIEAALQEGYSTAPPSARELGFGAGMGLPNIRRNTDRFAIDSLVGRGTHIRFTVYLKTPAAVSPGKSSILSLPEACTGCLTCLRACPTGALRVRNRVPVIIEHLCIDCPACIGACRTGALSMAATQGLPEVGKDTVLLIPASFLVQFGPEFSPQRLLRVLADMGFRTVRLLEEWKLALDSAIRNHARDEVTCRPVISTACGVVVNLIETRFPSLLEHLAPYLSPVQAARQDLAGTPVVSAVACPCDYLMSIGEDASTRVQTVSIAALRTAVMKALRLQPDRGGPAPAGLSPQTPTHDPALQVCGIHHVTRVLEEIENGLLREIAVVEPYACDGGCFGSPLLSEDAFVARHRWEHDGLIPDQTPRAFRRLKPFTPRPGLRLDTEMGGAIEKLSRIDHIARGLPGKNCGLCGSPTCAGLAEDIVMGRTGDGSCVYTPGTSEKKA
jgi:anti-sigma regulatory factor (Ser/Thr protein kinase)/Na+-translocating ferredoxin:NAD+ oxidoreductase RNF subunit RnfB